jgi:hypothetical protein
MLGKLRACGLLIGSFVIALVLLKKYCFHDVSLIRKQFLISQPTSKGGVDITELMTREVKTALGRGGEGTSSGQGSYLPRSSTVKKITSIIKEKKQRDSEKPFKLKDE